MADIKMDYNLLNDAKKDLHELANDLIPSMDDDVFKSLGDGSADDELGSSEISSAVYSLQSNAEYTMGKAKDGLTKLGDSFGSVGEAFLQFDAEIAQGMHATNSNLALSNYQREKATWDYYLEHKDECVGDDPPDFCSATDPGDDPPLDQTIVTDRGNVNTHLTLDDEGNVIKEETTVTYDGKTYTSVTDYSDDGNTIVSNSNYPDGSTVHNETKLDDEGGSHSVSTSTDTDGKKDVTDTTIEPDGSGTQTVTDSDGTVHEYTRGPDDWRGTSQDWVETPESIEENGGDTT
ncbi:hypothetical protein FB561_2015 [Kribbella amoyensis]|uniref:Uncharacterized protein n=1 Tax=Kribbella amoyensis TaxID=996641 RepID=A0A561BPW4_9ACTN|nr:hypothetical protein [Kribbella amoyensis]TWD80918.1 hypothetical protein FB561_2015 [Kribbella amoyensis]